MPRKLVVVAVLLTVSLTCAVAAVGQENPTLSPREELKQYVADLQKNPSDDALREKIIKLALTIDPKPATPDDAVVAAAKGKTIFAHAAETGSKDDLKAAADAFAKASTLAPWVAEYYFNQGKALEKAGQLDDAIGALNLYLLAAPNAPDASEVKGEIEGIKFEKDSAAKKSSEESAKAQAAAHMRATMFAHQWYDKDGTLAFEISGSAGAYACRPGWTSKPMQGEVGGTLSQEITRCDVSGTHLTLEWSEGADAPALNYHPRWTATYDLYISDDTKQLSGVSIGGGNRVPVVFVRRD